MLCNMRSISLVQPASGAEFAQRFEDQGSPIRMPFCARSSSAFRLLKWYAVVFVASVAAVAHADSRVEGSARLVAYSRGKLMGAYDGFYQLDIQANRYRLRLLEREPSVEHKILVVSDYSTIYQSEIYKERESGHEAVFASFDKGGVPNGDGLVIGWGMPQAYCLAITLVRDGPKAYSGTELNEVLIPDHVRMLSKSRSLLVRTEISDSAGGIARQVTFWGVTPQYGTKKLERSDSCVFLSVLEIQRVEKGIPTRIYFANFADDGKSKELISEYQLDGTLSDSTPSPDLAAEVTYDPGYTVQVVDTRGIEQAFYRLSPRDRIPFKDSVEYPKVIATAQEYRRSDANMVNRKKFTIGFMAASVIFFAYWIRGSRA